MTSDSRQKLMDKIDKLLRLSRSPNEHEASLAASMAQKMMDEHNLTMAEIEPTRKEDIGSVPFMKSKKIPTWEQKFLVRLSRCYDCSVFFKKNRLDRNQSVHVVGHKNNIPVFISMYMYLREIISAKADKEAIRARTMRDELPTKKSFIQFKLSFSHGCSDRIVERINESRKERLKEKDKEGKGTALICLHNQLVDQWIKENLNLRHRKMSSASIEMSAFERGRIAGNSISIHQQIENK